jgi:hypothetical protein
MRPIHRVINNVGYRKVYPMSRDEDSSFCHYCGREPGLELRLEWDHVPPLNVSIPEEFMYEVRKTLIRSCDECNRSASDLPHMDYLERHFWLKQRYLDHYKKLIISEGAKFVDREMFSGYLLAAMDNYDLKFEQIMTSIGFGIKCVDEINSPVLDLKTKGGQTIKDLLFDYLYGGPDVDEDEDEDNQTDHYIKNTSGDDEEIEYCSYSEFVEFLVGEIECSIHITNQDEYDDWCLAYTSRCNVSA